MRWGRSLALSIIWGVSASAWAAKPLLGSGVARAARSCFNIALKVPLREAGNKSPRELELEALERETKARKLTGLVSRFTGQRLTAQDMSMRNKSAAFRHMLVKSAGDAGEIVASWSNLVVGSEVRYATLLRNEEDLAAISHLLADPAKSKNFEEVKALLEAQGRFSRDKQKWATPPLWNRDKFLPKKLKELSREIQRESALIRTELAVDFEEYKVIRDSYEKILNATDEELRAIVLCVESTYSAVECFPNGEESKASAVAKAIISTHAESDDVKGFLEPAHITKPDAQAARRQTFEAAVADIEAWRRDFRTRKATDFEEFLRNRHYSSLRGVDELLRDWRKVKKGAFDENLALRIESFFNQRVGETRQARDMWEAALHASPEMATSDTLKGAYPHLFPATYDRHDLAKMQETLKSYEDFRVYLAEENARREAARAARFLGADLVRFADRAPPWLRPLFASLIDFEKRENFGAAMRKFEKQAHMPDGPLTQVFKDLVDEMRDVNPHMRREDFIETIVRRPDSLPHLKRVEAYAKRSADDDLVELGKEIEAARALVKKLKLPPMTVEGDNMGLRRGFLLLAMVSGTTVGGWWGAGGDKQVEHAEKWTAEQLEKSGKWMETEPKKIYRGSKKNVEDFITWVAAQMKKFPREDSLSEGDLEGIRQELQAINDKLAKGETPSPEERARLKQTIELITPKKRTKAPEAPASPSPASTNPVPAVSPSPKAPGTTSAPKSPAVGPPVGGSPASSPKPVQSPAAPKSPSPAKAGAKPHPASKSTPKKSATKQTPAP